jgi:hypothetical protein
MKIQNSAKLTAKVNGRENRTKKIGYELMF